MDAQTHEWQRREAPYRPGRPPLDLGGGRVWLIDDGLATGATMRVAVRAARALGARWVGAAAPVAGRAAVAALRAGADAVAVPWVPEPFCGVGQFYAALGQTSDAEVLALLGRPQERDVG